MQDISTRLKESTLMTFETRVENHILPSIGHKIIHKITTRELQELVNSWANKGSLPMLINNLKRLFKYAQKINALDSNPINGVIFPSKRKKKKDKKFWSKQELLIFLETTKNHANPVVYPLFRTLAFCGIRKGEALALSWEDVDIKNKQIKIHRNISRTKNRQIITTTKTNTSRLISIDDETLNVLLDIKGDNDLVFHQANGKTINTQTPYVWMNRICDTLDIERISVHGLRHTHASLLFEAGASIKEVQHRLGHANIRMTMDMYTHVTRQSRDDFAEKFANFIDF